MSVQQQTQTRNGITITFPAMYKSVEDYKTVCEMNLRTLQGPDYAKRRDYANRLIAKYMTILEDLKVFLA